MRLLSRFTDHSPSLRCSNHEAVGQIVAKGFVKDVGFGDCPQYIEYEFTDATGSVITGKHVGTESSYFSVNVGDRIWIRYLKLDSSVNAPKDALAIITPIVM